MGQYSITYQTVTPESATNGDFHDSGFLVEDHDATVDEAIFAARDIGAYIPSQLPLQRGALTGVYLSGDFDYSDLSTGEQEQQSIHFSGFTEGELAEIFTALGLELRD